MPRAPLIDVLWAEAERLLLAWNGVRLNQAYRKDWENAKPYMDYIRKHITIRNWHLFIESDVRMWLDRVAARWLLDLDATVPILPDPSVRIPFCERRTYARCFTSCFHLQQDHWEESGYYKSALPMYAVHCLHPEGGSPENCWGKYRMLMSHCPFRVAPHGGLYLRDPWEPPTEEDGQQMEAWLRKPAAKFDRLWRGNKDRALFWLDRMFIRPVLMNDLEWQLGHQAAERGKAHRPSWDQGWRRGSSLVEVFPDDKNYLVIAVDLRAPRHRVSRVLEEVLRRHLPLTPIPIRYRDLQEGFDLYEEIEIKRSMTFEEICTRRFGALAWKKYSPKYSWATGGRSRLHAIRNLDAAMKRAKDFIENREEVRVGSETRLQWKYWRYLMPPNAVHWEPTYPKSPPPIPVGPPEGESGPG